jgi:hypothetical protein
VPSASTKRAVAFGSVHPESFNVLMNGLNNRPHRQCQPRSP